MSRTKSPMIRLRAKVMTVCELPHDIYCEAVGKCHCMDHSFSQIHKSKKGSVGRRRVTAKYARNITFLVGRTEEIERAALDCPQVAAAKARGDLRELAPR